MAVSFAVDILVIAKFHTNAVLPLVSFLLVLYIYLTVFVVCVVELDAGVVAVVRAGRGGALNPHFIIYKRNSTILFTTSFAEAE